MMMYCTDLKIFNFLFDGSKYHCFLFCSHQSNGDATTQHSKWTIETFKSILISLKIVDVSLFS